MNNSLLFRAIRALLFAVLGFSSLADAAFLGRLETAPGSGVFQAYYDDLQDITWTTGINGTVTWDEQNAWAAGLNIDGVTGWRLPSIDVNNDGAIVDCSTSSQSSCLDNEYGHLYFYGSDNNLGGVDSSNPAPFSGVLNSWYWTSTSSTSSEAWSFSFANGSSLAQSKLNSTYGRAVYDGDVGSSSVVPLPATVWLFGSGLIGLVGITRRKKMT